MIKICVIDKKNRYTICSMAKAARMTGIGRNTLGRIRKQGISKRTSNDHTFLLFENGA